jgi:Yip1 domain
MSTSPVLAPQPPLSQAARVLNTFVAPNQTFADLGRNQSWWVPWLLMSVVSLAFVWTMGQKVGFEQVTRNEMAKSSRAAEQMEKLSPEQRDHAIELQTKMVSYFSYGSPVLSLIGFVIIAAVLLGTFNFGAGAEITFKQSMAVVLYSYLPTVISSLLGIVSLFVGVDPEGFNIRNPVASNAAYFMDPTQHKFLYGLVSAVDVFALWIVVLLAIGFASVSKLKRSTTFAIVLGWYVLIKLAGAGWATMN